MPLLSTDPTRPEPRQRRASSRSRCTTGHVVWSRPVPAGSESSPIAYGDTVYFGDQSGTVYALRAPRRPPQLDLPRRGRGQGRTGAGRTGSCTSPTTPAGPTPSNAATGHQVWAVTTSSGAHFGFGSGNFYATPAVAFGRVYLGNTDGRVYSFAARTGQLAWATGTGAYVYSSAAVADPPGLGPTVYVGSYDGTMYAFDARSGAVRWTHRAGGQDLRRGHDHRQRPLLLRPRRQEHAAGSTSAPGRQVFIVPRRRVQPGDRRSERDLPRRLLQDVPDAAARGYGIPRGTPRRHRRT